MIAMMKKPVNVEAAVAAVVVVVEDVAVVVHHKLYWKGKMQGKHVKYITQVPLMTAHSLILLMIVGSHLNSSVVRA